MKSELALPPLVFMVQLAWQAVDVCLNRLTYPRDTVSLPERECSQTFPEVLLPKVPDQIHMITESTTFS